MVYVYRLKMAVDDNVALEIDASSLDELATEFVSLGGDEDWLRNTAKAVVAGSLHGESVRTLTRSLGSVVPVEVESDPFVTDATKPSDSVSTETPAVPITPNASPATSTPPADDPWADEKPETIWPSEAEYAPQAVADKEWPGEASVVRTALASAKPAPIDPWGAPEPTAPAKAQTPTETTTDNFGRQWTMNHRDAPQCECGVLAAMMTAESKAGNTYSKWKCAKGASTSSYKSACALDDFVNKR